MDSFQFVTTRVLSITLIFLIIFRTNYSGTLKYNFEQLLLAIFYLIYYIFNDYKNSKENQLAMFFEENVGEEDIKYAKNTQRRVVLICFRPDGNGGIQGIVLDSFYMDRDGKIANEFYIVLDNEEGEIKRIEDQSIKKLEDVF